MLRETRSSRDLKIPVPNLTVESKCHWNNVTSSSAGYASLTNSVYLDVSTGIRDNGVFHAPLNCIRVEDEEEEEVNQVHQQVKSRTYSRPHLRDAP